MAEVDRSTIKIKTPPVLFERTQEFIEKIGKQIDGTFLVYWTSPNGEICHNDVQALYEVMQEIGHQEKVFLFLKSGGGSGIASLRIVNLLHQYSNKLVALLPLECASAATMVALGAHEIRMGPLGYLTAIDTSLTHLLSPVNQFNSRVSVSQDELDRVIKMWRAEMTGDNQQNPYGALYQYVHPLVVGAVDRSRSLSVRICTEILSFHTQDLARAQGIAEQLNSAYPSHGYPILPQEAARLGLAIGELDPALNHLLLDLNELYSEMGQRALTDYDERNYHNNEILNILEASGIQVFYQVEKDWHYRVEERQWAPMNDESSWHRVVRKGPSVVRSVFHIR